MEKFKFEVKEELAVLSEYSDFTKKLARVMRWGEGELGLDLRTWYKKEGTDEFLPGKGIFLSLSQVQVLGDVLEKAKVLLGG